MRALIIPLLFAFLSVSAVTREEAAEFLFGSLSLPDKGDYSREFYLENIDAALRAREEMSWGKEIPDKEFLHFVLPVRVNNENLDNSRVFFYNELKDKVKGLTMEEAILEVNHWCHEHVTYQPSDGRTSSPLSTYSQAIGRCGEESTFTVAALRSVGIPARQIYTPRWAHTDDNHAWVEAWANGKWHFIGACEPEAALDLAWFNQPASRGMLMTTNVAGKYPGPEETLYSEPLITRINLTENYADVDEIPVMVVYEDGSPATDATVNFCIYNYGEFYPVVTKTARNGEASLNAGVGDMLVWATDGNLFGFAEYHPDLSRKGNQEPVRVVLDKDKNFSGTVEFDIIPPCENKKLPYVSPEQRRVNDLRLAREDSIRKAYVSTFTDDSTALAFAREINSDPALISRILKESRGNHKMITECLREVLPEYSERMRSLLLNVSEKDRRDITREVIFDHTYNTAGPERAKIPSGLAEGARKEIYDDYILNPRIDNEGLRPWRGLLTEKFGPEALQQFGENPESLLNWIRENIVIVNNENPQNLIMSPGAVYGTSRSDPKSLRVFFVAVLRSAGLPARINTVTSAVEYMDKEGEWVVADVEGIGNPNVEPERNDVEKGWLRVNFRDGGTPLKDPKYYSHFSVSKITDGVTSLLEFDENSTLSQIFNTPYELEAGQYVLTSGTRMADGSVLARCDFFTVAPQDTVERTLVMRKDDTKLSVIGALNAENIYHDLSSDTDKSLLSTAGRGYYVIGLISPNHEPSEHTLNDISAVKESIEREGRKIIILLADEDKAARFDKSRFPDLPSNVVLGVDADGTSRGEIVESLNLSADTAPIFIVADSFNRIVWASSGYTIGLGEKLLSVLSQLE